MLYSNINLKAKTKVMPFGKIYFLAIGEQGRGRYEMRIMCPMGTTVDKGMNSQLTIGFTKSGNPRVDVVKDSSIYLLLSSKGKYTKGGCGWIGSYIKNKANYQLLAKGNGADGKAGKIGSWDAVLLKVLGTPQNDWIQIKKSGENYGTEPEFLYLNGTEIIRFISQDDAKLFATQSGIDLPNFEAKNTVFKNVAL